MFDLFKALWRNGRNTPKDCIFWKYITPWGWIGGWFFWPWAVIILNEGSKKFWVHWNLFFKLLKHGHFWINFRFWLVWVELRKIKALSSLNFLQRHEKYQTGSCPQLLYACFWVPPTMYLAIWVFSPYIQRSLTYYKLLITWWGRFL